MLTLSGREITPWEGVPTLWDLAVSLSRTLRFGGMTRVPWPVSLHCMAVADLLEQPYKAAGLFHDCEEFVMGDPCHGFKMRDQEDLGIVIRKRIFDEYAIPHRAGIMKAVKEADNRVAFAEIQALWDQERIDWYVRRTGVRPSQDEDARIAVAGYLGLANTADVLDMEGGAVSIFYGKLKSATRRAI